jgi:hypothetical protein
MLGNAIPARASDIRAEERFASLACQSPSQTLGTRQAGTVRLGVDHGQHVVGYIATTE